jgi:hypothetical protein
VVFIGVGPLRDDSVFRKKGCGTWVVELHFG